MNLILRKSANPVKRAVSKYQPTYSPFKDMLDLLNMEYPWTGINNQKYRPYLPSMNMVDTDQKYQIDIEVPGYDEENLEITVDGYQLTISGKRDSSVEEESDRYLYRERTYGSFTRTVTLPEGAQYDNIEAYLSKGVLTLEIPKNYSVSEPKKVKILNK